MKAGSFCYWLMGMAARRTPAAPKDKNALFTKKLDAMTSLYPLRMEVTE